VLYFDLGPDGAEGGAVRERDGRSSLGLALVALVAAACLVGLREVAAQTEAPSQEPAPPPAAEAPINPDAVSSFISRGYGIKPKKLWKGLLETLQAAGYPPEEVDEKARRVKTSFVDFDEKNFPEPVAGDPPAFGPDYPILQLIKVREGKVSLEAVIAPTDEGSALSLRARLLVHGLDRKRHLRVLTDRRSSGVIEAALLKTLEDRLGIKPI